MTCFKCTFKKMKTTAIFLMLITVEMCHHSLTISLLAVPGVSDQVGDELCRKVSRTEYLLQVT